MNNREKLAELIADLFLYALMKQDVGENFACQHKGYTLTYLPTIGYPDTESEDLEYLAYIELRTPKGSTYMLEVPASRKEVLTDNINIFKETLKAQKNELIEEEFKAIIKDIQ